MPAASRRLSRLRAELRPASAAAAATLTPGHAPAAAGRALRLLDRDQLSDFIQTGYLVLLIAVGESSVTLLHPPLLEAGVSIWTERGCQ